MTEQLDERTMRAALEQIIRERDEEIADLQQQLTDLADRMVYRGNSISWIHSKAENYKAALGRAWDALIAAGISPDGETDVAQGVARLAKLEKSS